MYSSKEKNAYSRTKRQQTNGFLILLKSAHFSSPLCSAYQTSNDPCNPTLMNYKGTRDVKMQN